MRKTNLKAVSDEKPAPLSYEEAQRLARGIADSAHNDDWLLGALMVFAREIVNNCRDATHVETVAMLLEDSLYPETVNCDRAQERFIDARREEFLKGGAR